MLKQIQRLTKIENMIKFFSILALTSTVGAFSLWANDKLITNLEKNNKAAKADVENSTPKSAPTGGSSSRLHRHTVSLALGQTFLYGDFSDLGDDSITGEAYYSYGASYSFDFIANFHYSTHDSGEHEVDLGGVALGIKSRFFEFDSFAPYAIAGLGFYLPTVTRTVSGVPTDSKSKVTLGLHLGAGCELHLNDKVSVGLLVHYHNPFDVKQDEGFGGEVEGSYGKLLMTAGYTF